MGTYNIKFFNIYKYIIKTYKNKANFICILKY